MTDQDRLLKTLITTFFVEFIDLFFPKIAAAIAPKSVQVLQPPPGHSMAGELPENCLLVKARLRTQEACFWIQFEDPYDTTIHLQRRIFHRFAQLDAAYHLPLYPIVIFANELPLQDSQAVHRVDFLDHKVLDFQFVTLKLKDLNWRDYLKQRNPVAAGLMATMNIQPSDRPIVKAKCLELLAKLKLDFQRLRIVSNLIEEYLHLSAAEEQVFKKDVERMGLLEREQVMEILASSGQQTRAQGAQQEARSLVLRLLHRRVGDLNPDLAVQVQQLSVGQIQDLGEALLDFQDQGDLLYWLAQQPDQ